MWIRAASPVGFSVDVLDHGVQDDELEEREVPDSLLHEAAEVVGADHLAVLPGSSISTGAVGRNRSPSSPNARRLTTSA